MMSLFQRIDLAAVGEILVIARKTEDQVAGGVDIEAGQQFGALRPHAAHELHGRGQCLCGSRLAARGFDFWRYRLVRSCGHFMATHALPGVVKEFKTREKTFGLAADANVVVLVVTLQIAADTPPRRVGRRGRFPHDRCGRRLVCTSLDA